jgi:hypothetical protein
VTAIFRCRRCFSSTCSTAVSCPVPVDVTTAWEAATYASRLRAD